MKKDKDKMTFILNRIKEYMNTYNCTIENAINWSLSEMDNFGEVTTDFSDPEKVVDWNHNDYELDFDNVNFEKMEV